MDKIYWALDYRDPSYSEKVCNNQLYETAEEAEAARLTLPYSEYYKVQQYTISDIEEAWGCAIEIEDGLYVNALEQ